MFGQDIPPQQVAIHTHPVMSTTFQRLQWSPNFVQRFGPLHGLRLLLQIVKNLPRSSHSVRTFDVPGYPGKVSLRNTIADHATFKQCLVTEQYDFLAFPQAQRLLAKYQLSIAKGHRPLIIDGGANIGLASLWFNRAFPEAQIIAVEPDADNFELLQKNTAHLGDRVTPVYGGLWHRTTQLEIINPNAGAAAFRVGERAAPEGSGISAFGIDDLCRRSGNDHPLIVKLDIEGAQGALFSANTDWVARTDLITLELDDWLLPWQGSSHNFFRCLSQYPFDYLLHKESIFCFRDEAATAEHTRPDTVIERTEHVH